MELRQKLNRLSLSISVPLAVFMLAQPHFSDPSGSQLDSQDQNQTPHYYLVKPEIQRLNNLDNSKPNIRNSNEADANQLQFTTEIRRNSDENILAKAKNFTSIQDFLDLNFNQETADLLRQMQADRFQTENPYHNLTNVYPVALMLSKGVSRWNRHVYRSSEFNQEYGYDVVKYEITHDDTSTSYILAYREKSLDQRLWLGEEDQRPTLTTFLVNRGDGRVFRMHFTNGEITQSDNVDLTIGLSAIEDKIDTTTPIASRDRF